MCYPMNKYIYEQHARGNRFRLGLKSDTDWDDARTEEHDEDYYVLAAVRGA